MWWIQLQLALLTALRTVKCQFVLTAPSAADCPAGLFSKTYVRGRSCFEFCNEKNTWMGAREQCHLRGGRLVSVVDSSLQVWLSKIATPLLTNENGVWLGLNRWSMENEFGWDDYDVDARNFKRSIVQAFISADNAKPYRNWAPGYPRSSPLDGKCVLMNRDYGWKWTTNSCWGPYSYQCSYICEYQASGTDAGSLFDKFIPGLENAVDEVDSASAANNSTAEVGNLSFERTRTIIWNIVIFFVVLVTCLFAIPSAIFFIRRCIIHRVRSKLISKASVVEVHTPMVQISGDIEQAKAKRDTDESHTEEGSYKPRSCYCDRGLPSSLQFCEQTLRRGRLARLGPPTSV